MMRISPLCWVFGHSRAIRIVLEHKRFGVTQTRVTTVKVECARCGEKVSGRVRSLTHSFPMPMDPNDPFWKDHSPPTEGIFRCRP